MGQVLMSYDCKNPKAVLAGELPDGANDIISLAHRMLELEKKQASGDKLLERNSDIPDFIVTLELDKNGKPLKTVENFLRIMRADPYYQNAKYNLLSFKSEIIRGDKTEQWSDADDAASIHFIENQYGLFSKMKHDMALRILFTEREYHPIRDIVDALAWDGQPRMEGFLSKWMGAADNPYTREVSRLIFAGGIHRLYHPGCKFDIMIVLIGIKQGEGKSTIVRWLALDDRFYSEATEIDSQKGVEQLSGFWIVEMGELLAIARTQEVEAVKAYISRLKDNYRIPYDKHPTARQRSCIFIGTTNNPRFLTDKTGNRRFLPLHVKPSAGQLFAQEHEVKEYIKQCWAEAKAGMDNGTLPLVENYELIGTIRDEQNNAVVDDWREGRVQAYLENQPVVSKVCVQELRKRALYPSDDKLRNDLKESSYLGIYMDKAIGWKACPKKTRSTNMPELGPQRCWEKENSFISVDDQETLFS